MFSSPYDFGYPWWMTWGHLVPFVVFGLLAVAGARLAWRRWLVAVFAVGAAWGLAGFLILNQALAVNQPLALPTAAFMPGNSGRVLDLGAGSGRGSLMVLQARPAATVVALDIYDGYWGINDNTPDRIRRNAAAAGVAERLEVQTGDMRELPFPDDSFDGVTSSFAIDHLSRDGIGRALREAARVLRPGGDILIMNVGLDGWIRVALPTPPGHGYFGIEQDAERWSAALREAGFTVVETGTAPGVRYYLARTPV
jgi:SAM-dependent methyltransferase